MLLVENTKRLGGIIIYGDYYDLQSVYDTISEVIKAPVFKDDHIVMNAFMYDFRHAYEGQRIEKIFFKENKSRKVKYFGVTILWPMFIFSLGLLRWGLSFIDSSKKMQSDAYRLESITYELLVKNDPIIGKKCIEWLRSFVGYPNDYLIQYFDECNYRYIFFSDTAKIRFKNLINILNSTHPLSKDYILYKNKINKLANKKCCSPHELVTLGEWPKFVI